MATLSPAQLKTVRMLWITDPWSTLSHFNDTTLRFIHEAVTMEIQTFWSSSDLILNTKSSQTLNVFPCPSPLSSSNPPNFSTGSIEMKPSDFHLIHYRVDPPVDFNYISLVDEIMKRDNEARIVSPPDILKYQSEKLPPKELARFTPRLQAIRENNDLKLAYHLFEKDEWVVTKPLNEAQSKGVKKVAMMTGFDEFKTWVLNETQNFVSPIVMQEYLPEVDHGEVRMWFGAGEYIAALKKFPKKGDFRVLIDEGSKIETYTLSAGEAATANAVGSVLKKQGVMLAAVDLIGGKISDYNITSPGLIVQLEKVHGGANFARVILEKMIEAIDGQ